MVQNGIRRFENHLQIVVETKANRLCGSVTRKKICQQGQAQRFPLSQLL